MAWCRGLCTEAHLPGIGCSRKGRQRSEGSSPCHSLCMHCKLHSLRRSDDVACQAEVSVGAVLACISHGNMVEGSRHHTATGHRNDWMPSRAVIRCRESVQHDAQGQPTYTGWHWLTCTRSDARRCHAAPVTSTGQQCEAGVAHHQSSQHGCSSAPTSPSMADQTEQSTASHPQAPLTC